MRLWLAVVAAATLYACGYVGPPQPPTLDIPATITDFRAWEEGDKIVIAFTFPGVTTENLPLKGVRSVEVGIDPDNSGRQAFPLPVDDAGPVTHDIPAAAWVGKSVALSVRAVGPKGKPSAWSNAAMLTVIPPLTTPSKPEARNVASGVELKWTGTGPRFRIFRAEPGAQPQPLAESDRPEYLDETTTYGTRYTYLVQAMAAENQWSVISDPAEITPADKFAPAVPEGVSAVPTPQSIELAWTRNTESDFGGYNIFRSMDGAPFERIASLIEAPNYGDSKIEAGKKYRYTVSAVDLTGNESAQSAPVEAVAQ